jgi:polysaccharide export outer membrane protein
LRAGRVAALLAVSIFRENGMVVIRNLLILMVIAGMAGCVTSPPNLPDPGAGFGANNVLVEAYRIDVSDTVQISVWKNPELSVSEPVRPDGMIAVPLVGDVMAAGRTPEELAKEITDRLAEYIKNPNVTVILTGLQGHAYLSRIRVTGAVGNNTSITYQQGMTVLDAILDAGSVDLYADSNNTKLHRRTDNGAETYDIRLKDILEDGDMTTNVLLMPGDVITVPERAF